jgi:hypothetical protein
VAVNETVRNPGGDGEHADQPLPLPKGVSHLAVADNGRAVPEPGLVFMSGLLGLGVLAAWARRRRSRRYGRGTRRPPQ